ncbi:MAG: 23S rRNA (adenine2503-C2)-methyltransferase [Myxococcota bacterium]|jgi:23S rRNA (adenine2503-C2)-methyltransferase
MGYKNAMSTALPDIDGLPRDELAGLLEANGIGAVHANRVMSAIHREGLEPHEITDLGPRKSAALQTLVRRATTTVVDEVHADDGTQKLVFGLRDGKQVESVLIPMGRDRYSLCVSSQVGCAMDCDFCATARLGLARGLEPGEIVAQVREAQRRIGRLHNVVFMGMGEPLHHYDATTRAIRVLVDHLGPAQPLKSITVSTVGLVNRIDQLAHEFQGRIQLAVSLNAGTEATRLALMPITKTWSMEALRAAVARYPRANSRKYVLVEYVLLAGVNDTPPELEGLIAWARGLDVLVNLIPWNPFDGADFRSPGEEATQRVLATLRQAGIPATIRQTRGRKANAACGQLALAGAR